jgi:hypothetical protein
MDLDERSKLPHDTNKAVLFIKNTQHAGNISYAKKYMPVHFYLRGRLDKRRPNIIDIIAISVN